MPSPPHTLGPHILKGGASNRAPGLLVVEMQRQAALGLPFLGHLGQGRLLSLADQAGGCQVEAVRAAMTSRVPNIDPELTSEQPRAVAALREKARATHVRRAPR